MKPRSAIVLLTLVTTAGVLVVGVGSKSPVKLVSLEVLTIPDRGRCARFVLENRSSQRNLCHLYLQQFFGDHWAPEIVTRFDPDETIYVDAGQRVTATLRLPDSNGRFRFQILHGKPLSFRQQLTRLTRRKLGLRTEGITWQPEAILTKPICFPE